MAWDVLGHEHLLRSKYLTQRLCKGQRNLNKIAHRAQPLFEIHIHGHQLALRSIHQLTRPIQSLDLHRINAKDLAVISTRFHAVDHHSIPEVYLSFLPCEQNSGIVQLLSSGKRVLDQLQNLLKRFFDRCLKRCPLHIQVFFGSTLTQKRSAFLMYDNNATITRRIDAYRAAE